MICTVDGCGQPEHARGLCGRHYQGSRRSPVASLPGDWTRYAACVGKPTGWFYMRDTYEGDGNRGRREADLIDGRAKRLCPGCVVRAQCLAHALEHHEAGYWGGTTEHERRLIRARRTAA